MLIPTNAPCYSYSFFYFSTFFTVHLLSSTLLLSSFFITFYICRAIGKIASLCKRFSYDIKLRCRDMYERKTIYVYQYSYHVKNFFVYNDKKFFKYFTRTFYRISIFPRHTYIHTHNHIYIHINILTYIHTCIDSYKCTYAHMSVRAEVYSYMIHTYVCI